MPVDPTPDGAGILNKPVIKPFPQPAPSEEDEERAVSDGDGEGELVTRDLEAPAETARPPLGN